MPQFDQTSFLNQVIWFSLIFLFFYFFIVYFFLPQINKILKWNKKKLFFLNNNNLNILNENININDKIKFLYQNFYELLTDFILNFRSNNTFKILKINILNKNNKIYPSLQVFIKNNYLNTIFK